MPDVLITTEALREKPGPHLELLARGRLCGSLPEKDTCC